MEPVIGRKTWRTLEPIHAAIYFAPEAVEEHERIGAPRPAEGYFASRSAAMGAVPDTVVVATFYNFNPEFVRASMDGVWAAAAPEAWIEARLRAADRMIRRLVTEPLDDDALGRVVELARAAALVAAEMLEGRPLFAGHAALAWPDEPHLALWHAQAMLREFRGDGHISCLVGEGLSGLDALVTHAAAGEVGADGLRATRRWSVDDWAAAEERLCRRGWLTADGTFTEEGRRRRQSIEDRTDELALAPYASLGEERCEELRRLARPMSKQMAAAFG